VRPGTLDEFRAIEADHFLMEGIFKDAAEAERLCGASVPDEEQAHCLHLARECLHRALFASIGLFGREERAIRPHVPAQRFQSHAACHAEITEAIQEAIADFAKENDAAAAFGRLEAIARLYTLHHRGLDAECRALLLAGNNRREAKKASALKPRASPALLLSGDARLDEEHTRLFGLHERARAICGHAATDCARCDEPKRESCTASTVDLLTDAIKFMVDHFRHEEELIRRHSNREEAEVHMHAHADISRRMSQLVGDYEDGNTAMCLYRLSEILRAWLTQHVVDHDLPLVSARGGGA
jgi:hemerythrin-like metal-binding protein